MKPTNRDAKKARLEKVPNWACDAASVERGPKAVNVMGSPHPRYEKRNGGP
eukprot:CAMPEP_0184665022 /NCGR_PEP_ID=MMETSP0308-20130426/55325_1 /TAXON_ID=38269 /ORGANISM="Gloeochaete witrockiana, Strain SAG 46.84" /LENGTH=50 /DNA_ID=CAMNT_0027108759 /DNA_START=367 /DNA_END=519 /DNA_ORIENTATION=+